MVAKSDVQSASTKYSALDSVRVRTEPSVHLWTDHVHALLGTRVQTAVRHVHLGLTAMAAHCSAVVRITSSVIMSRGSVRKVDT